MSSAALLSTVDEDVVQVQISGDEGKSTSVRTYNRRWLVLALFSLVTFSNGCIWITLSSVADITARYYQQSPLAINWLTSSYLLAFPLFVIPSSYIITAYGIKVGLVIATCLDGLAAALRYAGSSRNGFLFTVCGQSLAAVASTFLLQTPPSISAVWFPDNEKAVATSIGMLSYSVGISAGFFVGSEFVVDDGTDTMLQTAQGMTVVLLGQAAFCSALIPLVACIVKERPPLPPSQARALFLEEKAMDTNQSAAMEMWANVKRLAHDYNYQALAQAYSLLLGLMTAMPTLLNEFLSPFFPGREKQIGLMGTLQVLFGVASMLVGGWIIGKLKCFRYTAIILFFGCLLSNGAFFYALLQEKSFIQVALFGCLICVIGMPLYSIGLEHLAEITYPVPESLSSAYCVTAGNAYSLVLSLVFGKLLSDGKFFISSLLSSGVIFVGFLLVCVAKTKMRRTAAEKNTSNYAGLSEPSSSLQ